MHKITFIGLQVNIILCHIHCNFVLLPKLSDLEKANLLLIANASALSQYFPVEILGISNLRKYFEFGLIKQKKHNIGY